MSRCVVPRLWPESTVVCLGTGPSLSVSDVEAVRGKARVIAVNDAVTIAPWADALYAADMKWWKWHDGVPTFTGPKWSVQSSAWGKWVAKWPAIQRLRNTGAEGIERDPSGLRTGHNSGYQAINLAVHYGATRIVLLGYDMQRTGGKAHFFGDHPTRQPSPFAMFIRAFGTAKADLRALGVEVVNASRQTALTCFPRVPLEAVLASLDEVAA